MRKAGFFRNWSGTLFAALLALAVLMPAIDSFLCMSEDASTPVVTQVLDRAVASKDIPVQQHDDGDNSCIHGHCHHWVGFARIAERVAFASSANPSEPIIGGSEQRPSAPQLELLRPPQA